MSYTQHQAVLTDSNINFDYRQQQYMLRKSQEKASNSNFPGAIARLCILDQDMCRLTENSPCNPDIARPASKITNRAEQGICSQSREQQGKNNTGQGDDYQGSKANYKILVTPEKLVFCSAIEGERQLCAKVGFTTPEGKGEAMDSLMQWQDNDIGENIENNT